MTTFMLQLYKFSISHRTLKINDYCGFIREKQEKIKAKRSCYSNGSVRLIIVICFSWFYSENSSQVTLQTPKFLIMIPKTLCIILSEGYYKRRHFRKLWLTTNEVEHNRKRRKRKNSFKIKWTACINIKELRNTISQLFLL